LALTALPIESTAATWGQEVYFGTPVSLAREGALQVVEPGTVAFWTDGNSLALPFGPTPISRGGECRLASPCDVLGTVRDGDPVRVVRMEVSPALGAGSGPGRGAAR